MVFLYVTVVIVPRLVCANVFQPDRHSGQRGSGQCAQCGPGHYAAGADRCRSTNTRHQSHSLCRLAPVSLTSQRDQFEIVYLMQYSQVFNVY